MNKSLKFLRYFILVGLFLAPFTVLIVLGTMFFPFITGKNFFFRILVEIIFGSWLVLTIFDKKYLPAGRQACLKKNWLLVSVALFTFIVALSTIFGVNPSRSFWSNYERMEGLITFLHLFVFFLVMVSVLKGEKIWNWLLRSSLGVSVIVAIYGLLQMAGKLDIHQSANRLDATLGNASYLAIYMVFHIFIALMFFLKEKEWYKWFYLPVIVLNTVILYQTATRGAILGLIGGLILFAFLNAIFGQSRKIKIFSVSLFVVILVLLTMFWMFRNSPSIINNPVLARFTGISLTETTTQSRLVIWKMSLEGVKERPLLGWGPENYNLVFNKYFQPILWRQEPWFDRAHNVFIDRLTTNGILGLITYLSIFGCALYYLWFRRERYGFSVQESSVFTGLLAAYFFHNLFVFDNIISSILFFTVIGYITSRTFNKEELPQIKKNNENNLPVVSGQKFSYAIIIFIGTIFIIYFFNIPAIMASHDLIGAFKSSAQGDVQTTFAKFKQAISRNSFGTGETREHFVNFATKVLEQPTLDNNFKTEVYNTAVSEMKKQIESSPEDIRYMAFLSALYNKAGRYDEAIGILSKAVSLSPKKQQLYFELGSSYINKKNYEKGEETMKQAFELDPEYFEARRLYATSLIFNKKYEVAEKLMKDFGGLIITNEYILNAFTVANMPDKVVTVLEKFVEENPGNAQYLVRLAAAYLQNGERQKSIQQIQKAIEIEPRFKQQGEYLIGEIKAGRNPQ